jgi:hypothetical protein
LTEAIYSIQNMGIVNALNRLTHVEVTNLEIVSLVPEFTCKAVYRHIIDIDLSIKIDRTKVSVVGNTDGASASHEYKIDFYRLSVSEVLLLCVVQVTGTLEQNYLNR